MIGWMRDPRLALGRVAASCVVLVALPAVAQSASQKPVVRSASAPHAPVRPRAVRPAEKPTEITIEREVYNYGGDGRRDPFKSLLTSTELRPALAELRLVAVAFDPAGASVAILRNTKEQHRVRVGAALGRMRVAAIRPKAVVFTITELGYSRQETLGLNDPTAVRSK
jgi:hypothetical protein